MVRISSRILATGTAIAAAGAIALTGLTAASASPAAGPSGSGIEHFQLVTTSFSGNNESIIATGMFTAGGVDHSGNRVDTVVFPNGAFKITHSKGKGPQHFNPKTCLAVISQHGTYSLSDGTGKYAHLSGHGTYHVSVMFVGARNSKGKCSQRPTAVQQIITAQGPVSL